MTRLTTLKLGLLASAFAGAYFVAVFSVGYIEDQKHTAVETLLQDNGLEWAMAAPDGMQIILTGEAPDEAARFRAVSLVGQTHNPTYIRDQISVAPPPDLPMIAFKVEILRTGDTVMMHGLVPAGPQAPADLVTRVSAIEPVEYVSDVLTQSSAPAPDSWPIVADLGLTALADLTDARVEITPGKVVVDGVAPAEADLTAWTRNLQAQASEDIVVEVNLRQPRQRLSPFSIRLVNDGSGVMVETCAVETPQDAEEMSKALQATGGGQMAPCQVALGAPDTAWPEAASAAIASLAELGRGAITLTDNSVTVLPDGTVPADVLSAQGKALRDALPPSYKVSMLATKGLRIGETDGPLLRLTRTPDGPVTITGPISNAQDKANLAILAAARFGADNVTSLLDTASDLPDNWGLRSLAAVDALALLQSGEAEVTDEAVTLTGTSTMPDGGMAAETALRDTLGPSALIAVNVTYLPPLAPEDTGPDPQTCVQQVNDVLLDQKITFAPGSVKLPAAALPTIDAIAAVLRDCDGVPMEIGGHTDSQGRENMNHLLSEARANAVLDALAARRVLTGQLSAKGYGETQPITDNSTEEGREANRRIAFRLTPADLAVQESMDGSE